MFDYKHYVPILKGKEGEFKALQETFDTTRDHMTPLIEVVSIPWDYDEETEAKSINDHLSKIGKKLAESWGSNRKCFVESPMIEGNRKMLDNSTHHLNFLFDDFREKKIDAIPTSRLGQVAGYKSAVRNIVAQDKRGVCLRLQNADLSDSTLKENIDIDLGVYGVTPNETDLIIDLGSIGNNVDLLVFTLSIFINNALPYINEWRSLTFAGSSFPINLSEITANTTDSIERLEWQIWNRLLSAKLQRIPSFGDYSIAHPEILETDPRFLTISASIRYTCDNSWLIVRGRGTKKHGWEQYYTLCSSLIQMEEYCGAAFSWGDNYINECAARNVGTGNATTWRKVANNHHFQKVIFQLSILP